MASNDDLLAQLQGSAASDAMTNDDVFERLQAQPEDNPLEDVSETSDLETDAHEELNAVQQGFRDRAKREADRFRLATDSEYWFCVCFKTREDKEAFLHAAKLIAIGDKYLDGYQVARLIGMDLDLDQDG